MHEKMKEWWERRPYYEKATYDFGVEWTTERLINVPWFGWQFCFIKTTAKKFEDWS